MMWQVLAGVAGPAGLSCSGGRIATWNVTPTGDTVLRRFSRNLSSEFDSDDKL